MWSYKDLVDFGTIDQLIPKITISDSKKAFDSIISPFIKIVKELADVV